MKTAISNFLKISLAAFLLPLCAFPQGKYQSLLWEISGNGLRHPSYLFGTMHVSGKLVFHLADSFYYALRNVDEVALELNPEVWQPEMARMDQLQNSYRSFVQAAPADYLSEKSFRLEPCEEALKSALQSEPAIVNNLLYRSYKAQEDFEENTFLDLYIYQTAKRLHKMTTGVEDYFATEKVVMEAYADMARESGHENRRLTVSPFELERQTEDAYRRGDLDLLDSLETILQGSAVFREKFLLARNVIQANSIDTILKKHTLFVGVGAAHLPGNRGVIELLRAKGYFLRPVRLDEKNAYLQDTIDRRRVPVVFQTYTSPDGAYTVSVPGSLYKLSTDTYGPDRYQYADMSNGSYYMVTRVQTYGDFEGDAAGRVFRKIDSLLYENIPGKILDKRQIELNGCAGFDIVNQTRTGDIQRYQVYVTPFEVLIFKMSGRGDYVRGPEAETFFHSVQLPQRDNQTVHFTPAMGGFSVDLPSAPHQFLNTALPDGTPRWEFESLDPATGNSFMILKKAIHNFGFLDPDTFSLGLVAESFGGTRLIRKELARRNGHDRGEPFLEEKLKTWDGAFITARILLDGAQYVLLAVQSADSSAKFSSFFASFRWTPFHYGPPREVTDTFLHFTVTTPIAPEIDPGFRSIIEHMIRSSDYGGREDSYLTRQRHVFFRSDSTGEIIAVNMEQLPEYYHPVTLDSLRKDELDDYLESDDLALSSADSLKTASGAWAWRYRITDTGTSRCIERMLIVHHDRIYRIAALCAGPGEESSFIKDFFTSFNPGEDTSHFNIQASRSDLVFRDFRDGDSLRHARALKGFTEAGLTKSDLPQLMEILQGLSVGDRDYWRTKVQLIRVIGFIRGTGAGPAAAKALREIYDRAGDTIILRNEVLKALAHNRSEAAYKLLKQLLVQDPPVFEGAGNYSDFFDDLRDSLPLARKLFPDLLQLLAIDDYKDQLTSLLAQLADSGLIGRSDYQAWFTPIFFDARVEMKRQQLRDENKLAEPGDADPGDTETADAGDFLSSTAGSSVDAYATLLMPFYDGNPEVAKFMNGLLHSHDLGVRYKAAVLFLKYGKRVPDSILLSLAGSDRYRADLYEQLAKDRRLAAFPAVFRTRESMARSVLLRSGPYHDIDSLHFVACDTVDYRGTKSLVYYYMYRLHNQTDWKIAFSGTQPLAANAIRTQSDGLTSLTESVLDPGADSLEQCREELHKLLIASHPGDRRFYLSSQYDPTMGN